MSTVWRIALAAALVPVAAACTSRTIVHERPIVQQPVIERETIVQQPVERERVIVVPSAQ